MLKLKYRTDEIEKQSQESDKTYLVANIGKPHQLFQGQCLSVLCGVAIKSDQHVFAVPTKENNKNGLIPGCGLEVLDSTGESEVEVLLWNRNQQGQPRMIEITPGMRIAEILVMANGLVSRPEPKKSESIDSLRKKCDDAGIKYKVKDTIKDLTELLNGA